MTAADAVPPTAAEACPLCGTPVAPDAVRCSACGYHLAGFGGRPGPFSVPLFWWTAMGFLAVYLVTLAVVAMTR